MTTPTDFYIIDHAYTGTADGAPNDGGDAMLKVLRVEDGERPAFTWDTVNDDRVEYGGYLTAKAAAVLMQDPHTLGTITADNELQRKTVKLDGVTFYPAEAFGCYWGVEPGGVLGIGVLVHVPMLANGEPSSVQEIGQVDECERTGLDHAESLGLVFNRAAIWEIDK